VPNADRKPESPDFDQALAEVERIIASIESGEIGLEQSIAEYERGATLLRVCRERLVKAEQKVRDLTAQLRTDATGRATSRDDKIAGDDGNGDKDAPF
jgi:exodeoxyribonuclease VII small subunit